MPSKFHGLAFKKNDVLGLLLPAKVLDDALDKFCTPGNVADVDGVVQDLDAESVNLLATEKRRALPHAP